MAGDSRLTMGAYRKFSDVLQNQIRASASPKSAKPPKGGPIGETGWGTLDGLGALADLGGVAAQIEKPAAPVEAAPVIWGEAEAERAAIVEHDGRIPRTWAEGFARLDPDQPPADVPLKRWQRFIDDVGRFLESPFCAVAAALGWGSHDLFGADRDRAFARIDRAGLLWLLNGDKLLMLAQDAATIETRTGARQTYRCKPPDPGRVLAWELTQ
jgi:hypothetical protein